MTKPALPEAKGMFLCRFKVKTIKALSYIQALTCLNKSFHCCALEILCDVPLFACLGIVL